jgi:hypothetical protein
MNRQHLPVSNQFLHANQKHVCLPD